MRDPCFTIAIYRFMNESLKSQQTYAQCSQECTMTEFTLKTSSLSTPLEWQMPLIKRFVERSNVTLPSNWSTKWREQIRENYLSVTVLRETHIVEKNTQSAKMSPVDVLSNIGGQTGLWIGISLLSIMELIEMLYRLIRHQCHVMRVAIQKK